MGGSNKPLDPNKEIEQPGEKKKGLIDWRNLMKPGIEEKDHWVRFSCLFYLSIFRVIPIFSADVQFLHFMLDLLVLYLV